MAGSAVLAKAPHEPALPQSVRNPKVPLRGIGLIVASTVFFSGGDVIAKQLAGSLPPIEITWLRYVVFALTMIPFVWHSSSGLGLRSHRPGLQVLRGLGTVASALFFISSLPFLPMADATAINFISPILITARPCCSCKSRWAGGGGRRPW